MNIRQSNSTFSLRSLFAITLSIAVPLFAFTTSVAAGVITTSIAWAILLTYLSKPAATELSAPVDRIHEWLQNYTSGCLLFAACFFALATISVTYFPSSKQIAFAAVESGDIARLKSVLPRVDRDKNLNLLNAAAEFSGPEIVELLLEKGWDPNHQEGHFALTPLHLAITYRSGNVRVEIVRLLLYHGADPAIEDTYGDTPEEIARFHAPGILSTQSLKLAE